VITWAAYDEIKDAKDKLDPNGRAGKYNWNLSFGYKPTMEEYYEARENARKYDIYPHWGYYVNLSYNVTKEPGLDKYSETTKIINQGKYDWGSAPLSKPQIDDEILTLASSEEIFKLDNEIKDHIYSNIDDEIDFEDLSYGLVMGDVTTSSMPGMEIIETITGITMPTSRYSWTFQDGTVFRSGDTFSAAVDVESGQLLYVLKVTGSELYSIFNS